MHKCLRIKVTSSIRMPNRILGALVFQDLRQKFCSHILRCMFGLGFCWFITATLPSIQAQDLSIQQDFNAPPKHFTNYDSGAWLGLYTTYWFSKKWGYYGEYHLRRADFVNRMSKLYLRFGVNYKVDTKFRLTLGVVNRYTWSDYPELATEEHFVPEYRFWEQALFSAKYFGLKIYHQLRTEQRWKRSTKISDPTYYYYNRFRYKFLAYAPLIGPLLETNSLFLTVYNEIFMQAGKRVEYNYFEDNRAYIGLGYGLSDSIHLHVGYMKSFGQLNAFEFRDNDIFRLSIYHKLSFFNDVEL
ncbi:MAG: hypothetical protein CMH49_08135 [Myxococcales bacterium]|nr:hypothetical protein [Myxococcales bacterium]